MEKQKQMITETRVSFDNEEMTTVVSDGKNSSRVTLTDKSIVVDLKEEKNTPKGVKVWQCRCEKCKYDNKVTLPLGMFPKYCMNCSNEVIFTKKEG